VFAMILNCKCGRSYQVDASYYHIQCLCGFLQSSDPNAKPLSQFSEQKKLRDREQMLLRVKRRGELDRKFIKLVAKLSREGEGLGSTIDRLETSAVRFGRNELALRLRYFLEECSCERSVAIERLNSQ
jgi:hypothetical protein